MKHTILPLVTLVALVIRSAPLPAATGAPEYFNYQGQLLNNNGTAATQGNHTLELAIYDLPSVGNVVWGPQIFDGSSAPGHSAQVPVDNNGRFSLKIGPVDTSGRNLSVVGTNLSLYVEIKVDGNPPIFPRQQVLSTPFAFNTTRMGGYKWDDFMVGGNPVTGKLTVGLGGIANSIPFANQQYPAIDAGYPVRVRQGADGVNAGVYFMQRISSLDRAFIGMLDDNQVEIWGAGSGPGLVMNVNSGVVKFPVGIRGNDNLNVSGNLDIQSLNPGSASGLHLGPIWLFGGTPPLDPLHQSHLDIEADKVVISGCVSAVNVACISDERIKTDISLLADPLESLLSLKGVSYTIASQSPILERSHFKALIGRQAGVIAQDVQRVLPEAVSKDSSGLLSVNYNGLTALLIEAVKVQQHQIDRLADEIKQLKAATR